MSAIDTYHVITIEIDSTDMTAYMKDGQIRISNAIDTPIDTCDFVLVDTTGSMPAVSLWDPVTVKIDGSAHWVGYVRGLRATTSELSDARAEYSVHCESAATLCASAPAEGAYTSSETDAAIIADLFSDLITDEGFDATTHVSSSGAMADIAFSNMSLIEAMDYICSRTGYAWYVDGSKNVWYFDPDSATGSASFDLSDNPNYSTTYPMTAIAAEDDAEDIRNRVTVKGGHFASTSVEDNFTGTGAEDTFTLTYKPTAITSVTVAGTAQTVGMDLVDGPTDYDCLVNYEEQTVKWYGTVPASGAAIVVTYHYAAPIEVTRSSDASHTEYGRWFDYTLINTRLTTLAAATEIGDAMLDAYAFTRQRVCVTTPRQGIRSGQEVDVTSSACGLSAEAFIVQSVTETLGPAMGVILCELDLGAKRPDLADWMQSMSTALRDQFEEEAYPLALRVPNNDDGTLLVYPKDNVWSITSSDGSVTIEGNATLGTVDLTVAVESLWSLDGTTLHPATDGYDVEVRDGAGVTAIDLGADGKVDATGNIYTDGVFVARGGVIFLNSAGTTKVDGSTITDNVLVYGAGNIRFYTSNTYRGIITTTTFRPASAGGLDLGTTTVPWGDVYAAKFYDGGNNSYYLDPASSGTALNILGNGITQGMFNAVLGFQHNGSATSGSVLMGNGSYIVLTAQSGIDHGSLGGLSDVADHAGYVTLDGARALTGDWNAGNYEIRTKRLYATNTSTWGAVVNGYGIYVYGIMQVNGNATFGSNIIVGGTVDGVDVANHTHDVTGNTGDWTVGASKGTYSTGLRINNGGYTSSFEVYCKPSGGSAGWYTVYIENFTHTHSDGTLATGAPV